jgi:hypothetical protein
MAMWFCCNMLGNEKECLPTGTEQTVLLGFLAVVLSYIFISKSEVLEGAYLHIFAKKTI